MAGISEVAAEDNAGSQGSLPEDSTLGLSRAIVNSILTTGTESPEVLVFYYSQSSIFIAMLNRLFEWVFVNVI